jgi:hypothetical protein
MPKSIKSTDVSKYIFVDDESVKFVVYRVDLKPTKALFSNLDTLIGTEDAEAQFQAVVDDEATPPSFIIGLGSTGGDIYDTVYSIMYSESICHVGNDISIDGEEAILYDASGYGNTSTGESDIDGEQLKLRIDEEKVNIIRSIVEIFGSDFSLDQDDDEDEFIAPLIDLSKTLKKFDKFDNVYTYKWDDLDDLVGLSRVWPFVLRFEE